MRITDSIKKEILLFSERYMLEAEDRYNFWEEHIKYVVQEAISLAEKYGADTEIVELAALLHDIALITKTGTRADHHATGAELAETLLVKYGYPQDKTNRVKTSVFNHRSSKNGTSVEDICVADADILAHFDNIPMLFNVILNRVWNKESESIVTLPELRKKMKESFEYDYNDLSERTRREFNERYELICRIVLGL
ncbi:MAG: HD domain-containing protein [Oscillospiraceae bacterium]|nr:HD domain-containing protein [Oscillospiraceae bacterium]